MSRHFHSFKKVQERAKQYADGYLAELESIIVERTSDGIWIETDLPAYGAMKKKYRKSSGTVVEAVAENVWPRYARAIAKRKCPGEVGVGDTLARMIASAKGHVLAEWYTKITGKSCGCADRQEKLNQMYPYQVIQADK